MATLAGREDERADFMFSNSLWKTHESSLRHPKNRKYLIVDSWICDDYFVGNALSVKEYNLQTMNIIITIAALSALLITCTIFTDAGSYFMQFLLSGRVDK
ncbi:hypothetical protein CR513_06571, partial [Mucuna pruriens]